MVLEACVVMYLVVLQGLESSLFTARVCLFVNLSASLCRIDNSEWTRNGDYAPSRLEAAKEAANYLANRKLASNVENCVAVMTMGSQIPKCLLSLASDQGKVATTIGLIQHEEGSNFESSLQIAQIVLKHRQNTNQKQRIVVFVGSPLGESIGAGDSLAEIGRRLKKNGVAVDIIDYGTENRANTVAFERLIEASNAEEHASRLVTIPPVAGQVFIDALLEAAPEVFGRVAGSSAADGSGFDFGVDPEMDPELALALKLSMEEEMARQKREDRPEGQSGASMEETGHAGDGQQEMEQFSDAKGVDDDDEEMMLARAIALSMEQSKDQPSKL